MNGFTESNVELFLVPEASELYRRHPVFLIENSDWRKPKNMSRFYYIRTNPLEDFVPEFHYVRTRLLGKCQLVRKQTSSKYSGSYRSITGVQEELTH